MTIDAEALCNICTREGILHILYTVGQSAAFVSGERNNGLTLQVVSVLLEEGEHHLRISAPPYGTTDEYGVVATQIDVALVLWQFAFLGLFLCQINV